MRTVENGTRAAVVNLLRAERGWRRFFQGCCKAGVSRLWASSYQFHDEFQKPGEWHAPEEIGDVLLSMAREKLPDSPAAQRDAEWASRLSREALERLAEHLREVTKYERAWLNLEAQDEFHEQMNEAGIEDARLRSGVLWWVRRERGWRLLRAPGTRKEQHEQ